jgi:hypothetical protein
MEGADYVERGGFRLALPLFMAHVGAAAQSAHAATDTGNIGGGS